MRNPYPKETILSNVFGYLTLNEDKQPMPLAEVAEALQVRYMSLYNATVRDKAVGKIQCKHHDGKLCVALPGFDFSTAKVVEQAAPEPETPVYEAPPKETPVEDVKDELEPEPIETTSDLIEELKNIRRTETPTFIMMGEDEAPEQSQVRVAWDSIDGITVSGPDGSVKLDDHAIAVLQKLFNFHSHLNKELYPKEIHVKL